VGWGFIDIYVLAPDRSAEVALMFVGAVIPDRDLTAEDYEFPGDAEAPAVTIRDVDEAVRHAAARPGADQQFTFRNAAAGEPTLAMVYFTGDCVMVLGITIPARQEDRPRETDEIAGWLVRLQEVSGASVGYALYESPPPCGTVAEFVGGLAVALPPKLVGSRWYLRPTGRTSAQCG
jgi:hypothetical protein